MNQPIPQAPDFEKFTWKCPCCKQDRMDKFIKVNTFDIGDLFEQIPGVMFINVKYCIDVPSCQQKAFDRRWVVKHFFNKDI